LLAVRFVFMQRNIQSIGMVLRWKTIFSSDLSICSYLFFDDEIGVDWNQYANIRDWLARIRALPRWKHPYQLLPGHPIPDKKSPT
jgi:hypothetical protein